MIKWKLEMVDQTGRVWSMFFYERASALDHMRFIAKERGAKIGDPIEDMRVVPIEEGSRMFEFQDDRRRGPRDRRSGF